MSPAAVRRVARSGVALVIVSGGCLCTDLDPASTDATPPVPTGGAMAAGDPVREVRVAAHAHDTSSGFYLRPGDRVEVTATGRTTTWKGRFEGTPAAGDASYPREGCPIGALVGSIGLPVVGGITVCFGSQGSLIADREGILYLRVNDGFRIDNTGELTAGVSSRAPTAPTVAAAAASSHDFDAVVSSLVEIEGERVVVTIPTELARRRRGTAAAALARLDAFYDVEAELIGSRPFGGEKIRIYVDPTLRQTENGANAYMISGQPIRVVPEALDNPPPYDNLLLVHDPRHSPLKIAHELAHDFTIYGNEGRYMIGAASREAWADMVAIYAAEKLGYDPRSYGNPAALPEVVCRANDEARWIGGAHSPLCMLHETKARYGWGFFERFFRSYAVTPLSSVPPTDAPDAIRYAWLKQAFDQAAGEDTAALFRKFALPVP